MNNLQRMLVIPPTLFEKWRELILEDKHLTDLDLKMKKIIKLKNVPTGKKWYLYRQQLMMEANRRRNKPYLFEKNKKKHIFNGG